MFNVPAPVPMVFEELRIRRITGGYIVCTHVFRSPERPQKKEVFLFSVGAVLKHISPVMRLLEDIHERQERASSCSTEP